MQGAPVLYPERVKQVVYLPIWAGRSFDSLCPLRMTWITQEPPGLKAPGVPHSSFLAISDQGLTTVILMVAYLPEPSVAFALMVAVPLRLGVRLPSSSTARTLERLLLHFTS